MAKKFDNVTSDHEFFRVKNETFWTYNAHDVYVTASLVNVMKQEIRDLHQMDYFERRYWPMVPAVIRMQERGLPVDEAALVQYRAKVTHELESCDEAIRKVADNPKLNVDSDRDVGKLLYEQLGLKVPRLTEKTKQPGVAQEDLIKVLQNLRKKDEPARPVLMDLFHRSKLHTLKTRYLTIQPINGWIFPRIKLYGTETGRLAYADPPLQQWPPSARHIFRAPEGYVFVGNDYSQVEAKVLAILSNDEISLRVFAEGGDVHAQNAMDLFGISPEQWGTFTDTQAKAYRNFAKTFLYGISYGGNPTSIHTKLFCPCARCEVDQPPTLSLTRTQIQTAAARWFYLHRAVGVWQQELLRSVCAPGRGRFYVNPLGRKRLFFEPWPTCERPIKNAPMQMTAASIMDLAMIELDRRDVPMNLQMHDQFLALSIEEQAPQLLAIFRRVMEAPVVELGGYSFRTDGEIGPTWGDMKKVAHS